MNPRPKFGFIILGVGGAFLTLYFNARALGVGIFTEVGVDVSDRLVSTEILQLTLLPVGVGIFSGIVGAVFCFSRSMYALGAIGGIVTILIMPAMFDGGIFYLFWETAWAPILMLFPLMWFTLALLFMNE